MYKISSALFITLFLILALAACGDDQPKTNDNPSSDRAMLQVTVSEALVFDRPSRDSNILFRLIEGDKLFILAQTEPDLIGVVWYQVAQGDEFGWVAGSQVNVTGDLSVIRIADASIWEPTALPITPTITETSTPFRLPQDVVGIVNVSQATIFDTPSRDAPEVGHLFEGEEVDILGRVGAAVSGDDYFFIGKDGSAVGWVLAPQLNIEGDLETVAYLEDTVLSISGVRLEETATINAIIGTATAISASENPAETATPAATIDQTMTPTQTTIPLQASTTPDLAGTSIAAATATLESDATTPAPAETTVVGIRAGIEPPLEMTLLPGWESLDILVPISTVYLQGDLPVTVYEGMLNGDIKGTMWLVWGFPNITSPSGDINLYGDGVQLLRSLIFDPDSCNIGLGNQPGEEPRHYNIGGQEAVGSTYAAVDCIGSEDIAGFFAVLQVDGGNFAFFLGVEPVTATSTGLPQMQTMLDSVTFTEVEATEEP